MDTPQIGDVLHVSITDQDILDGVRCDCATCPTALAVKRLGFPHVEVLPASIVIAGDELEYQAIAPLPHTTTLWILSYDESDYEAGDAPSPIEFDITITEREQLSMTRART